MEKRIVEPDYFLNAWSNVNTFVWAINIRGLGTLGRSLSEQALAAQAQAVKRGVGVSRIFVLEPNDTPVQRASLRGIVVAQISVGIKAYIVDRATFDQAKTPIPETFGSDDAVFIDYELVYIAHGANHEQYVLEARNSDEFCAERRAYNRIRDSGKQVTCARDAEILIPV